ncbi:hypothetical protein VUR80DRAFT_4522 [Thermomyces stellatus]
MVLACLAFGVALSVHGVHAAPRPQTVTVTPVPIPQADYTGTDPPPIPQPVRTWLPPELSSLIPTPGRGRGDGGDEQSDSRPTPTPQPDQPDPENNAGENSGEGVAADGPPDPEQPKEELGCRSTDFDYVHGGTYSIDVTSDEFFFFTSEFKGCENTTLYPYLVDPEGYEYPCSWIYTQLEDTLQYSECDVLYSEMSSRNWSIIIEAYDIDFAVQRDFELVAGILPKATVTPSRSS